MDVHVRVDIDEDGPLVVKSAGGHAVDRLRHEHRRLARAVHPGVVALARHQPHTAPPDGPTDPDSPCPRGDAGDSRLDTDSYVLHTRYAGEPVARWTGTVAGIAGLGAAVASTLADLHALGFVHGRIDGSHILIGDDSRPRLCGLSHPGDAAPADDVAALGAVLDDLLARAPAGRWRLVRGSAGAARALRQVIERATDPTATRRPSAGALADAILAAVPGAALPAPIGSAGPHEGHHPGAERGWPDGERGDGEGRDGERRDGEQRDGVGAVPGRGGAAQPDTLDRIWSFAGEQSDDERWAAAFGSGPRDLPVGGVPSSAPAGTLGRAEPVRGDGHGRLPDDGSPPSLPMARVDTLGWSTTDADDDLHGAVAPRRRDLDHDQLDGFPHVEQGWHPVDDTDGDVGQAPGPAHDTDSRAWRDDHAADDHLGQVPRHVQADGLDLLDRGVVHDHTRVDGRVDRLGDAEADAWGRPTRRDDRDGPGADESDDLLTRDHRVPVPHVARSRPGDDDPNPSDRARGIVVVAALATATCLAVAGVVMISGQGGADDEPDDAGSEAAASRADCPPTAAAAADVDGDGCPEGLVVDGSTVDAGVARWTLGEPGDLVTVGDWDCDGEASAALLRPTTGDVFVFAAWAPSDRPLTVGVSQRVDGGVGIRTQPAEDGCDHLLVDRADGTTATVEVPR